MALSKDWREFLELFNSRGVDYADLASPKASIPNADAGSGPRGRQQSHRLELHERRDS
jgi:hypothetical protein